MVVVFDVGCICVLFGEVISYLYDFVIDVVFGIGGCLGIL